MLTFTDYCSDEKKRKVFVQCVVIKEHFGGVGHVPIVFGTIIQFVVQKPANQLKKWLKEMRKTRKWPRKRPRKKKKKKKKRNFMIL